jgi:hypothetical protein
MAYANTRRGQRAGAGLAGRASISGSCELYRLNVGTLEIGFGYSKTLFCHYTHSHSLPVLHSFLHLSLFFKMSIKSTLFLSLAALSAMTEAVPTKRASAGKRGLAFPKQNNGVAGSTYTQFFKNYDQITWMYDWEAVIDGTPVSGLEYVPLLHSNQIGAPLGGPPMLPLHRRTTKFPTCFRSMSQTSAGKFTPYCNNQ